MTLHDDRITADPQTVILAAPAVAKVRHPEWGRQAASRS